MCELATVAKTDLADEFLWQEVLEPLGPERRRLLAMVCDLGGADDDLASAAAGAPVALSACLAGVALVAVDGHGWHKPHSSWRPLASGGLPDADGLDSRRPWVR